MEDIFQKDRQRKSILNDGGAHESQTDSVITCICCVISQLYLH